jgi:hypothetical protein
MDLLSHVYSCHYKAKIGDTACILQRLEKLEQITKRILRSQKWSEPIGRPHLDDRHSGQQLIDLLRKDEEERQRLGLVAAVKNPWGC